MTTAAMAPGSRLPRLPGLPHLMPLCPGCLWSSEGLTVNIHSGHSWPHQHLMGGRADTQDAPSVGNHLLRNQHNKPDTQQAVTCPPHTPVAPAHRGPTTSDKDAGLWWAALLALPGGPVLTASPGPPGSCRPAHQVAGAARSPCLKLNCWQCSP